MAQTLTIKRGREYYCQTQNLLIKLKKLVEEKVGIIFTQSQYEGTRNITYFFT